MNLLKEGLWGKAFQLYVTASLPRPFYCVQNPSCTPDCIADLNSSFTKLEFLLLATNPSWWEGQGTLVVYPSSRLTFSAFDKTHIHLYSHFFALQFESSMKDYIWGLFHVFPKLDNMCLVSLAVSDHCLRLFQPVFSFGLI